MLRVPGASSKQLSGLQRSNSCACTASAIPSKVYSASQLSDGSTKDLLWLPVANGSGKILQLYRWAEHDHFSLHPVMESVLLKYYVADIKLDEPCRSKTSGYASAAVSRSELSLGWTTSLVAEYARCMVATNLITTGYGWSLESALAAANQPIHGNSGSCSKPIPSNPTALGFYEQDD